MGNGGRGEIDRWAPVAYFYFSLKKIINCIIKAYYHGFTGLLFSKY